MAYIHLLKHSPLEDLLPLNLCASEGHPDDLACFRAQHVTVAILALHTKDGIFTGGSCMQNDVLGAILGLELFIPTLVFLVGRCVPNADVP